MLKTDPLFVALGVLNLGHHHVNRIDVSGGANFRYHDKIQTLTGLFHHIHNVAVHVMGVQTVDSD